MLSRSRVSYDTLHRDRLCTLFSLVFPYISRGLDTNRYIVGVFHYFLGTPMKRADFRSSSSYAPAMSHTSTS